ncbi:hypothetical protein RRF57_009148 [Xylaria bambusicola]|uniref:Uncharacterized protein n=1 Tax=Xylaria bambusicola TaxID=326684 RepID=A0AAN7UZ21_9PEZI
MIINPTRVLQANISNLIEALQKDLSIGPQFASSHGSASPSESLFVPELDEMFVDPELSNLDLEQDMGELSMTFRKPVASLRPASSVSFPVVSDINEDMEIDTENDGQGEEDDDDNEVDEDENEDGDDEHENEQESGEYKGDEYKGDRKEDNKNSGDRLEKEGLTG